MLKYNKYISSKGKTMKDFFITNNTNIKFLDKIKESLDQCNKCYLSVSFIKKAGLILFENNLENALKRGAIIKIITSTYQNFTDILSLETFNNWMVQYPNFKCHLDIQCFGDSGFHSKGYIFEYDNETEVIIGSTNITRYAILKNIEWNVALYRNKDEVLMNNILKEFNTLWNDTLLLNNELIEKYKLILSYAIEKWDMDYYNPDLETIKPNLMQRNALKELRRYRDLGVEKALVIAATGSGKTYLAAFDARNFNPKRLLFIVHRDTILNDALNTFKNVFGNEHTYGFYTGKTQDLDCDFIFATSSMIARHLDEFSKDEFDYLVYDEVHHIMADNGKRIFTYFKPSFLLGLTATPERMDNQDVLAIFENNVPFELRLRDAIINDLVVPFHYYAIKDEFADYSNKEKAKVAREIAKEINVEFIKEQIEKRRIPGKKLKAIAFCISIEHCKMMANQFNEVGYKAIALTGGNNFGERIAAFKKLQDNTSDLEIICAVDILNEGVDIPSINMVLFLRPTESQTIFLQQLGRGLRKYEDKEYLTVLDFIGNNYERSFQIALALGTLSKTTYTEKQYLTDLVMSNFATLNIPNVSIYFDDLAKTEIINYINQQNFNKVDYLKKDYENFKKYLGLDKYMDYLNCEIAPDLIRFMKCKINNTKNKSYYTFLKKIDEATIPYLTDDEINLIDQISELLPIVRCDEMLIIRNLINNNKTIDLAQNYQRVNRETLQHALKMLVKEQILTNDYQLNCRVISEETKNYLNDLVEYALTKYEIDFGTFDGKFKLMGNYYKEQIMRLLLEDSLMFMKGTKFTDEDITYIFVGLKKDASKEEKLNYKDKFISPKIFQWESENNTTLENNIGKKLVKTKVVHLFIRKMDNQDGITLPFTYFGTGTFTNMRKTKNNTYDTLTFDIVLDNEVSKDYYLDFEIPEGKTNNE